MKAPSTVFELADRARAAAKNIKAASDRLMVLENDQRQLLEWIGNDLFAIDASTLCARDQAARQAIDKMRARVQRLHELRNIQELGAFQIQATRLAEAVFASLE